MKRDRSPALPFVHFTTSFWLTEANPFGSASAYMVIAVVAVPARYSRAAIELMRATYTDCFHLLIQLPGAFVVKGE